MDYPRRDFPIGIGPRTVSIHASIATWGHTLTNCPSCGSPLHKLKEEAVLFGRCPDCKGMWFADGALQDYIQQNLASHAELPYAPVALAHNPISAEHLEERPRECPHCSAPMRKFNYAYDSNIMLDRCPVCSGVWADHGETYRLLVYNKGNPKLDKLAASVAQHVDEQEHTKDLVEAASKLASPANMLFGFRGVLPLGDDIPRLSVPFVTVVLLTST